MGKRKSTDKSSESPFNKSIKQSPNKMKNPPQTPIQGKPTLSAQSERKKDFKRENNKRKSLPPKLVNGDEETSAKKPKIEPFTGTVNLFTEVQKGNSPATNNKKLKKENKPKNSPPSKQASNKKNTNAGVISSDANEETERTKARLEKLKLLRITSKERFKTKLAEAASGNDGAIAQVVAHITRLEQQKTGLSKSAKRRLGTLKRVLRNAGISEESLKIMKNSQKQQTNEIVQNNAAKEETKQDSKKNSLQKHKNRNSNVRQQKIVKKEESSNEDESEESADNSQSGIVNIKAEKLPQIKKTEQESSEDDDSEDLAEDDESMDEEDESMDEEDENLVKTEMIEDEAEEDDDDEAEESDEDSEDDDDVDNQNNDEDNNEESSNDEDDDDDGDNVLEIKRNLLNKQTKLKSNTDKNENEGHATTAKSRYVLFVGNLPYDVTKEDITEHFSKAGQVRDIRIPLDKQTNKPRGFAFVEMPDQTCYEKALSLHQTFIKGRKINVLYTQGGKKNSDEKKQNIKAKNFKLQAMRQQGKLAGNVKESQKRSFRRTKQQNSK